MGGKNLTIFERHELDDEKKFRLKQMICERCDSIGLTKFRHGLNEHDATASLDKYNRQK